MSSLRFDGRVAVVTGAGAGLGREYALLFAERGAKVVVNDLGGSFIGEGKSQQAADVVVAEIVAKGGTAVADYNSVTEGEKIIQTALDNFGRVDILVNNAGILRDRSFARISEQDWNLVHDVHLKGSHKTTQAAWPIFKKQNYGRIIMTSSTSGTLGNFGQANYSAAKMGLIGLSNTLAIEGAKNNIHCNVIVPTAASRMTQDILPEFLYNELKPKLIAPVVVYLCHESNTSNGDVIASAAGWAGKMHLIQSQGAVIRVSLNDHPTPESVQKQWHKITDMSNAKHLHTSADAMKNLMEKLEYLGDEQNNNNQKQVTNEFAFGSKDLILYALGIGATVSQPLDLKFLYENHADFSPFPTFFVMPGLISSMSSTLVADAIKHTTFDLSQILHGEQYLEIVDALPSDGVLTTKSRVIDVQDKKSGALVVVQADSYDASGRQIVRAQSSTFIVRAGNFGGKSKADDAVIPAVPTPNRKADASVQYKTSVDQAALYRLSGDFNPLHIDPDFAILGGQPVPILHGLCTLGFSARAVVQTYAGNDASLFKAIKVRFSKPVIPGQTLRVDMWQNGQRIHFKTSVVETGQDVITGAYVDLKMVVGKNLTSAAALQSDAVFAGIKDRVLADPAKAKSVNAIFAYKITSNGQVAKEWTLDLKSGDVYEGAPKSKADTTLTVADQDMIDIALGKLNPQVAFMKGKLKITGNIMLTQKLVPLLKTEAKL